MDRQEALARMIPHAIKVLGVTAEDFVEGAEFKKELEADSLDLVEFVMALEEEWDITIPEQELGEIVTVGQAIDVVFSHEAEFGTAKAKAAAMSSAAGTSAAEPASPTEAVAS